VSSRLAPDVTLRPSRPDDAEFLLAVYGSTREEELSVVAWSDAERDAFLRQQFTAQDSYWRSLRPTADWDVIEVGGRLAGRFYVDRMDDEIRIVDIALAPDVRDRGIGRALIAGVQDEADGRCVTIHVERGNRARALYERLGFVQIDSTGVYDLLEWRAS
jgi:ribosomal protein S18 acetylase RimI-like enzyme